jgi:CheY-like chemotaxis protein
MDRRRTALLVERDAKSRFVLRTALGQKGYRVLAARSRAEALDLIAGESRTPDVLLLDDPSEAGAYRVVALPNASSDDVAVRLVGWRRAPAVPARLGDVLAAVEEVSQGIAL